MKFHSFTELGNLEFPNQMERKYQKIKSLVTENIQSQERGLDMARVRGFFENYTLKVPEIVVTDYQGLSQMKKIFEENNYMVGFDSYLNNIGTYLPEIEIVVVNRHHKLSSNILTLEEVNGSIAVEGFIVHEVAHGTASLCGFCPGPETPHISRTGFWERGNQNEDIGAFWEEGFAEYMRVKFLESSETHIPQGMMISPDDEIRLPLKFSVMNELKEPQVFDSSIAGYALECLCNMEPLLLAKLIASRKSESNRDDCINFIESRWEGLYSSLKSVNPTYNGFKDALQKILILVKNEK